MKRTFNPKAVDRARKSGGLTYRVLALQIGVTEQAVRNWTAGRHQPLADQLAALADALGVDMDSLFKKGSRS